MTTTYRKYDPRVERWYTVTVEYDDEAEGDEEGWQAYQPATSENPAE